MKSHTQLIIGLAMLLIGIGGLSLVRSGSMPMVGMGMMGQGNMKGMMNRMMGDQLPPGIDAADLPDPQSRGAHLLTRYCTQCHDLPPPALHTAAEWVKVLDRMERHMHMMARTGSTQNPTEQEQVTILNYLQRHAAGASE